MKKRRSTQRKLSLFNPRINPPRFSFSELIKLIISWGLLILVISTFVYLFRSNYFRIHSFTCVYFNQSNCPEEVIAELNQYLGTHILFFSPTKLQQKLNHSIPLAGSVDVNINFPQSINVHFTHNRPIAHVKTASSSAMLVISENMQVTDMVSTPDLKLPLIIYPQAYIFTISDIVNDKILLFALKLSNLLQQSEISFETIEISSPQEVVVELSHHRQAIFSAQTEPSSQVTTLQLFLSKATINPSLPIIDLRYDQVVLRP